MKKKTKKLIFGIILMVLSIILFFTPIPGDEIIAGVVGLVYLTKYFIGD